VTSAQAKLYRFLQSRVSFHLESGNTLRALRIANVLTAAARIVKVSAEVKDARAQTSAAPAISGAPKMAGLTAAPAAKEADDNAPVAPSGPEHEHARLRFDIFFQAAEAHRSAKHFEVAQKLFEEALAISDEDADQIEALEIAHLNHNFASLFDQLGDDEKAEQHYQQALDILDTLDPPPKEQIANIANNLAMISRNANNLELAEERYLRALAIFDELRGPEHLDVAVVCNNLGSLYWAWRHPEMARDLHLRALAIRRKHLADDHPDVAQSACNLAAVYHDLKDFDRASRNYQRGLKILRQHIADDPDSYDVVAQNYAELLRENSQEKKADNLLKKVAKHLAAAEKKKSVEGVESPD